MIREATLTDVPQLVEMGRAFRAAVYADSVADNPSQMHRTAMAFIEQPNRVIFVSEGRDGDLVSMIGLVLHTHFISGDVTVSEGWLWVEPAARGSLGVRLIREAMAWGRLHGAVALDMVQPIADDDVGALYQRLGGKRVEIGWRLDLTAREVAA